MVGFIISFCRAIFVWRGSFCSCFEPLFRGGEELLDGIFVFWCDVFSVEVFDGFGFGDQALQLTT